MENQFVSYEIALKLKELGFNEHCFASYTNKDLSFVRELFGDVIASRYSINNDVEYSTEITAPLYQQVFEWFRNNNNMHHNIVHQESSSQEWYDAYVEGEKIDECGSYRQAEIACINKLIELVYDK